MGGGYSKPQLLTNLKPLTNNKRLTRQLNKPTLLTTLKHLSILSITTSLLLVLTINIYRTYSYTNTLTNAVESTNPTNSNINPTESSYLKLDSITNGTNYEDEGTSSSDGNITITPPPFGGVATGKHTINITTNNYTGYSLSVFGNGGDEVDLVPPNYASPPSGNDTRIKAVTGKEEGEGTTSSLEHPTRLANHEWGIAIPTTNTTTTTIYTPISQDYSSEDKYRLGLPITDSAYLNGGLDNQANQELLKQTKYAPIPTKGSNEADTSILTTTQASGSNHDGTASDSINLYYGIRIDNPATTRADTYQAEVTYTVTANLVPAPNSTNISTSPSIYELSNSNSNNTANNQTATIKNNKLTITGPNLASTYDVWVDLNSNGIKDLDSSSSSNETCTNLTVSTSGTNSVVTCNLPSGYHGKTNTLDIHLTTQGGEAKLTKAITYLNSICQSGNEDSGCIVNIDEGMIPIYYDEAASNAEGKAIWKVANPNDPNNPGSWYDYSNEEKQWANAVTVKADKLADYQQAVNNKDTSKVVDEADILGYWVYIPRFSYEVMRPNATDRVVAPQDFNIVFETKDDVKKTPIESCNNTNPTFDEVWKDGVANNSPATNSTRDASNLTKDYRTECLPTDIGTNPDTSTTINYEAARLRRSYPTNQDSSNGSSDSDSNSNSNSDSSNNDELNNLANGHTTWATHPAFTWSDGTKEGTTELNGFWIGKFELTGKITEPTVLPNSFANVGNYIGEYWTSIASMGVKDNNNTGGGSNRTSWNKTLPNGETINQSINDLKQNSHNLTIANSTMLKNDQWGAVTYLSASQYGAGVNKVYNNAARVWYYQGEDGLYYMYKDDDGNDVDSCYYSRKSYDEKTGKIISTDTAISCFLDADGNPLVNSEGSPTNAGGGSSINMEYTYTYTNESGEPIAETATVSHYGGNHTGCGPYNPDSNSTNATGSVTAYESCEPNSDHAYNGDLGQLASTTNNVYGVYDMAGGTWDYVAANLTKSDETQVNGDPTTNGNTNGSMKYPSKEPYVNLFRTSDGFDRDTTDSANGEGKAPAWSVKYPNMSSTDSQPWRVYFYNNDYCQWDSCGGQALHETKNYQSVNNWTRSWGSDFSYLFCLTHPWLIRGGRVDSTSAAGVFASNYVSGWLGVSYGSRAALAGY